MEEFDESKFTTEEYSDGTTHLLASLSTSNLLAILYNIAFVGGNPLESKSSIRSTIAASSSLVSFILLTGASVLGALLWGKWGLFKPQGIQVLKSGTV